MERFYHVAQFIVSSNVLSEILIINIYRVLIVCKCPLKNEKRNPLVLIGRVDISQKPFATLCSNLLNCINLLV